VVVDELLLDLLGHASKGVEGTLVFTSEAGKSGGDFLLHLFVLGLSETGVEGVSLHGASAPDAGGDYVFALGVDVNQGVDITEVLGGVLVSLGETDMVVLNDGVEEGGEERVGLGVGSVDTDSGV